MSLLLLLPGLFTAVACSSAKYLGQPVGSFQDRFHGVRGEVFAVDSRTLYVRGFAYDGQGPDAYFYAGSSGRPSGSGFQIPNEKGSNEVLKGRCEHVSR